MMAMPRLLLCACLALACVGPGGAAHATAAADVDATAWFFDASDPGGADDQLLVVTLQAVVNRDAPRLFLRTDFWVNRASDDFWVGYLSRHHGLAFSPQDDLASLIADCRRRGLIRGLVLYPAGNHSAALAAAMWAARQNLLPVTDRQLALQGELLSRGERWSDDDMTRGGWRGEFASAQVTHDGLRIGYTGKGNGKSEHRYRVVRLDPQATPTLEVEVSTCSGPWKLVAVNGDVEVTLIDAREPGRWSIDLRQHLPRVLPRGQLQFHVAAQTDAAVTVRRVRLLTAQGQSPAPPPPVVDCFAGLAVWEDFRTRLGNEDEAAAWTVRHLLGGSDRQMAFSAMKGWWNLIGADLVLARGGFLFAPKLVKSAEPAPMPVFDAVMGHLQAPAAVLGWAEPEWIYAYHVSRSGHFIQCSGAPNLSFWQHVPAPRQEPLLPQPARHPAPLADKHYVCIQFGDGDAPKNIVAAADLLPFRDKPYAVAQGMQPWLAQIAPALLNAYARLGAANVSYFAGPTGAGYCNPSVMPNLDDFARHTTRQMKQAGLSAIDLWDMASFEPQRVHRAMQAADPQRVRAYFHAPVTPGQPAANFWLDDGTPVLITDHRDKANTLWGYSYRGAISAAAIESRIRAVAARQEPPFFILHYGHMTPAVLDEVVSRLSSDGFEFVGADDVERLARQAGTLVATPRSSAFVPGQAVQVELVLHNPDDQESPAGRVSWRLPPGWGSDAGDWSHPAIPPHQSVARTLSFTAAAGAGADSAVLTFTRSGQSWPRRVRLARAGQALDLLAEADWSVHSGGEVARQDGCVQFRGSDRASHLRRSLVIDFNRRPVLELSLPRAQGKWSLVLRDGEREYPLITDAAVVGLVTRDLASTGLTGTRTLELRVHPAWSLGHAMTVDWMRLLHLDPVDVSNQPEP
jgi:hypothetical protein